MLFCHLVLLAVGVSCIGLDDDGGEVRVTGISMSLSLTGRVAFGLTSCVGFR